MSADLFARETAFLKDLQARAGSDNASTADIQSAKEYAKLLRVTKRLMRLSDRNEAELSALAERERSAATELADQKTQLEALSAKLAKYLSPQIYQSIFSGQQEVKVASRRKKLTILFSDLSQFTRLTDKLEAEDLTALLNRYMTEMSDIALHHGATIDKFIGDAIMVFFGDPESRGIREDATACVRMAIDMQNRLTALNADWVRQGLDEPLRARIGINTGYCTVGNFGGDHRLEYTIIGGAVNLAARLEKEAKPGAILLSHDTWVQVRDHLSCTLHGKVNVRGIAHPVKTYEVDLATKGASGVLDHQGDAFRMFLDPDGISSAEREEIIALLQTGLTRLTGED